MNLEEINARLGEIRTLLESDEQADLEKLSAEINDLEARKKELEDIELRKKLAAGINAGTIEPDKTLGTNNEERNKKTMYAVDSKEYREAFMKRLMGKELTVEERGAMDSGDASGGAAIPTITLDKIIQKLGKASPILGEIDLMHIEGNVTIGVEGTVNDAELHTENAVITGSGDTLVKVSLGGFEIVKIIPISAKLSAMSINAFENWLVNNLTRSVAKRAGYYTINGTGSSQPRGIEYADTWVDDTNAIDWAGTAPTVTEVQEQIGLIDDEYVDGAKWLMSFKTFWTKFHPLRDEKKPEVISGNNKDGYFIFGFPVIFDSKVVAGVEYFGNFFEAVKGNFAAEIKFSKSAESGFTRNAVDYKGDCLYDCKALGGNRIIKGAATL